ncbi:hypothetical protein [Modestobacter sp. DSM 44400]|uniref:hypothetical protein n=1 Tax=Modestobacter sp. DSM 44400 TaxID=1550230 RepID=UPI00352AD610
MVGHRWRTLTAAAGLSGLRLHGLQHFYASGLIDSGCDVVTVQRALDQAPATTTLSTYSHLWPTPEDRTRDAAQQLFADSWAGCGPGGLYRPLTCGFTRLYTLKRNVAGVFDLGWLTSKYVSDLGLCCWSLMVAHGRN